MRDYDAVVVGAGFAGLYMLYTLRKLGLSALVLEAGKGVGGTWYWNRYPGARCDTDSVEYSYQFSDELQQEWNWTERFATQPEILSYLEYVADHFSLRSNIQFDSTVSSAKFNEEIDRWVITTEEGICVTAVYCLMATGCLSAVNEPRFSGLKDFDGQWYHTGKWPHDGVNFSGQKVGVVGTGSSAIQSIPVIAEQATSLTVFQRQPNYSVPAYNSSLDPGEYKKIKENYSFHRQRAKDWPTGCWWPVNPLNATELTAEEQQRELEERWAIGGLRIYGAFNDLLIDRTSNEIAAEFVRNKIRDIVEDPLVAERLSPNSIMGCKRICLDSGYYATFNRDNVNLIDIAKEPILDITPEGIRTKSEVYKLDSIVFAIGFDAMTGALNRIDIRGINNISLLDKWTDGPRNYLGLATAGFPNFFTITGPGSPSVLTNMIPSIEQHVEWISGCIKTARKKGVKRVEATVEAEESWVQHNREVAEATLFSSCNSWYIGANISDKPRVFLPYLGGFPSYVEKCKGVADNNYDGFIFI